MDLLTFYREVFYGRLIPDEDFPRVSARAEEILELFEREYTVRGSAEGRNKAICALAEEVYLKERAASAALSGLSGEGLAVASQSIGSVSESYRQTTPADYGLDLSDAAAQKRFYLTVRRYLMIYRGVC